MPQAVALARLRPAVWMYRSCCSSCGTPVLSVAICKCFQKLSFSGSDFGNPQRFQIPATRSPQAVARAVARSCVDASRLQPKLLHALLSPVVLQMLEKLQLPGSDFGNLNRFQTPATHMPQAVARAVAHSCVDISQLLLKLRIHMLSVVICNCFQKL